MTTASALGTPTSALLTLANSKIDSFLLLPPAPPPRPRPPPPPPPPPVGRLSPLPLELMIVFGSALDFALAQEELDRYERYGIWDLDLGFGFGLGCIVFCPSTRVSSSSIHRIVCPSTRMLAISHYCLSVVERTSDFNKMSVRRRVCL